MNNSKYKYKKTLVLLTMCIFLCTATILLTHMPIWIRDGANQDLPDQINASDTGYIEVRVYDSESGVPLSYTTISITNETWGGSYTDFETPSSNFKNFTRLSVGWYTINVSKAGYKMQSNDNLINWEGDDDYLNVYLEAWGPGTGYIEVRILDSDTTNPISNALVEVSFMDNGSLYDSGYTDGSGFYNATGLDIGWYTVTASKDHYFSDSKDNYINWNGDDDYLDFDLVPNPPVPGYIEVTVRDNSSNLLSNAYVTVQNDSAPGNPVVMSEYTNINGFYNVTGLSVGHWWIINVSKNGYKTQSKLDYINWEGDDDYLNFNLVPWGPNTGYDEIVVANASGSPLSNAVVFVIDKDSAETVSQGYTDISGFYNATGLAIGDYYICVFKNGYVTRVVENKINWNGDDDYHYFFLSKIDDEQLKVRVFVKRQSAKWLSVPNSYVKFIQSGTSLCQSNTLQNGYADGYNIDNTTLTLEVRRAGYNTYINSSIDLSGYNMPASLDLYVYLTGGTPGTGYIEVIVRESSTSQNLENASIRVQFPNGTWFDWGKTDTNGFVNITDLYEESWYIMNVTIDGYISQQESQYINWAGDDDYEYFFLNKISFTSQTLTLQSITPDPDPTGDINLDWSSLYWVENYKIYRGTDPGSMELVASVSSSTLAYLDIGVAPGSTVYYQIIATNGTDTLASNIESISVYDPTSGQTIPGFEIIFIIVAILLSIVIKRRKKISVKSFFKNL
ncbi:MAG: hypothetical protein GF329_18540 [Candidatus Lokiarchaeota archaeon]|nr:hypothetical protein [Candidatus Lokiarchaeota archaeon]